MQLISTAHVHFLQKSSQEAFQQSRRNIKTLPWWLAGTDDDEDLTEEQKASQLEEAQLAESMERLIMEAYQLLQQGDMQQAESLLQEGAS